ncbi:AbrB/MazE/SpoVT family DNA-binding domain-containing protein [Salipaludibacillus aurantiacus]|uniref:SpoVT-AbrB domain-containing protein n=1 Tax=Salipaludibacillus aurantiacus TaxID=1601833 RepID=A0A1H9UG14_9BACI|nr:AbrB/MazE/SpoVT family DNA-binding domain-containing protein [Salipaludibacillus aurantiacus]SES08003.1 hypothetical protein SAMN05518684_107173 [Salipaludibacillus aurantiacus]
MAVNIPQLRRGKSMSRKVKRVSVSSKRQVCIPKDFYNEIGIGKEILMEVVNNRLVIKPVREEFEDFSEDILKDLVSEGYEGEELITKFKQRKAMIQPSIEELAQEAKDQDFTTADKLFSNEEDDV